MIERRFFKAGAELRASQGDEMSISGYAARFNVTSHDLNGFREQLSPGCFTRSLQSDRDVKMLLNHDPSLILGRKANGTLSVTEDDKGLRFRCNIADTTTGRDTYKLIQRNDLSDCSFAFEIDGDEGEQWSDECDENSGERFKMRTIRQARLYDCSVVGSPAYPQTSVSANSRHLNSRSMIDLFPAGIPKSFSPEIRSLILRSEATRSGSSRQKLMSLILS